MRARRGVAIPTALFIVLMLFGLVTAIQLLATENLRVTRYGHAKTRAGFIARATVDKLLFCLNTEQVPNPALPDLSDAAGAIPSVDQVLPRLKSASASAPVKVRLDANTVGEAWVQLSTDPETPGMLLLNARGHDGEQTQSTLAAIEEQPRIEGMLYVRISEGLDAQASTYYVYRKSTGWQPIPPVPNTYYKKGVSGLVSGIKGTAPNERFRYARNAHFPVGDDQGHLYLSLRRSGNEIDTVMRHDIATGSWSALPNVPQQAYKATGPDTTQLITPTAPPRLRQMASNGSDKLYVRWPRSDQPDTIFEINPLDAAASWSTLPPVRKYIYDTFGRPQVRNGFVGALTDLGADKAGNLYARWPREGVDTIYRFDRAQRIWSALEPPPRRRWLQRRVNGEVKYVLDDVERNLKGTPTDLVALNMRYLQVDRVTGKLYAIFNREGIDTIYELTLKPTGEPLDGPNPFTYTWKVRPPAPKRFYRVNGQDIVDRSPAAEPNAKQATVDGSGKMYFRWSREGVDSLFEYDTERASYVAVIAPPDMVAAGSFDVLPPPPNDYFRRNENTLPAPLTERPRDNALNIVDLAGGGLSSSTQKTVHRSDLY